MNETMSILESEFVAGVTSASSLPPPALAEIAFAGRSNVGKSSLLNAIMGRRHLVRVGKTPGTTRQVNFFRARASGGLEIVFVDLPGYGFAKRGKGERREWGPLVETYLSERVTLRAVVLLVDVRRGLETEERELIDFLQSTAMSSARRPPEIVVVATKIDKLPSTQRMAATARVGASIGGRAIGFSAMTGAGKDELSAKLRDLVVAPLPSAPPR
jgi:GTP-binding protein